MECVKPMLAKASTRKSLETANWAGYVLEPKHDGMRAVVVVGANGVEVFSRSGKKYAESVPHLVEEFAEMPVGTVLDGELAVVNGFVEVENQKVPVVAFNDTMRIMGSKPERAVKLQTAGKKISFLLFDLLRWGDEDFGELPQNIRYLEIAARFDYNNSDPNTRIWTNPVYVDETKFGEVYDQLVEAGIEGAIMKNIYAPYVEGKRPNKTWYKVKSEKTFDVVVMGFTEANEGKTGKFKDMIGAIKFGAYDAEGELKYVGRCSGMNDEERKEWTERRDAGEVTWVGSVIEVKANELVGSGEFRTPRHPQYVTKRVDKFAEDCKMDQFKVGE